MLLEQARERAEVIESPMGGRGRSEEGGKGQGEKEVTPRIIPSPGLSTAP